MAKSGYIKLHRELTDHWIYDDHKEPFDKLHAWIDLLMLANFCETKKFYKGELKTYKAGQLPISDNFLSERWHWSRGKTRRFLILLEKEGMISKKRTPNGTTLTIENWGKYQVRQTTSDTTDSTTGRTTGGTHYKNNKEYIKNSDAPLPATFTDDDGYEYVRTKDGLELVGRKRS